MSRRVGRGVAVATVLLVAADWTSKFWIRNRLALGDTHHLWDGWVSLAHRENHGIAFGIWGGEAHAWRAPLLLMLFVVAVLLLVRFVRSSPDVWIRRATLLVLSGAVGNGGDRLLDGAVTDWLLLRGFPFVFNLADIAIVLGAAVLGLRLARDEAPANHTAHAG